MKPEDTTIVRLRHLTRWPPVRKSKSALDSGFHTIDSGFQVLDSGPFVGGTWIPDSNRIRGVPDSLSCIPDSTAKMCWIPLYGARLEIPESFNLSVSCSTLGSINLKKRKQ